MGIKAALIAGIALAASAAGVRAEEMTHGRLGAVMDSVFGAQNWRLTGGYRTPERENQLRAQGALTVPEGVLSRHSMGRPGAPGAFDVVVDGVSPWEAAARLRGAGAPFQTLFPEGAHGGQGPHLHVVPFGYGRAGARARSAGIPWLVADPTPAQLAVTALRNEALQDRADAQLRLGQIYAQGRIEPKDLVEAYVWTALAASNDAADPPTRREADLALGRLSAAMSREEIAQARRFAPRPTERDAANPQPCGAQAVAEAGPPVVLLRPLTRQATAPTRVSCAGSAAAVPRLAAPAIARPALRPDEQGAVRIAIAAQATPAAGPDGQGR